MKLEIIKKQYLAIATAMLFAFTGMVAVTQASHQADTNGDNFISVAEGVPFYGGIEFSLTEQGDVSADSALALSRYPTANSLGDYEYSRTFVATDEQLELLETGHIVIHGIDIDGSGNYDGDKASSIAPNVPFEATVPAACGVMEETGNGYVVDINELNGSDAEGEAQVIVSGNEVTVIIEMEDTARNLPHAQHIHVGGSNQCPPNTDGAYPEDELTLSERLRLNTYQNIIANLERTIDRLQKRVEQFEEKIDEIRD